MSLSTGRVIVEDNYRKVNSITAGMQRLTQAIEVDGVSSVAFSTGHFMIPSFRSSHLVPTK